MPTIDEALDELIGEGKTPEQIAARAAARLTEAPKQYHLDLLMDPLLSPPAYALQLSVSNWAVLGAFFATPPPDEMNLQRAYQSILADISESLQTQNAQKLILSMMLAAKAVKP